MSSKSIEQLMKDAEAMAAEVERSLSRAPELSIENFPQISSQQLDYIRREAEALVEKDLQDIERQLSPGLADSDSSTPALPSLPRRAGMVKRHNMI